MSTTRGDIERDTALLLGEDTDNPAFGEPMWLRRACVNACDHVARATDCYYTWFEMDLNGDPTASDRICLPPLLYKLKRVRLTLADGTYKLFSDLDGTIVNSGWMDRNVPDWIENPEEGEPDYLALNRPDCHFYPRPNWDAAAGVRFYGLATPGEDWAGTGVMARTDGFPLPEFARQAVVYHGALLRCIQFPTKGNLARIPALQSFAQAQIGLATRDAQSEWARGRVD